MNDEVTGAREPAARAAHAALEHSERATLIHGPAGPAIAPAAVLHGDEVAFVACADAAAIDGAVVVAVLASPSDHACIVGRATARELDEASRWRDRVDPDAIPVDRSGRTTVIVELDVERVERWGRDGLEVVSDQVQPEPRDRRDRSRAPGRPGVVPGERPPVVHPGMPVRRR